MSGHVDQAKQLLKPMLTPHATRSSKHTFNHFNPIMKFRIGMNLVHFGSFWCWLWLFAASVANQLILGPTTSDREVCASWFQGTASRKQTDPLTCSCPVCFHFLDTFDSRKCRRFGLMLLRRSVMWVSGFLASTHPCGSTHRCSHSPSFTYVRSNQCGKSWGTLIWVCTFFLNIFSFVHWEVRSTNDNFDPCDIKHDQTCADELRHYRYLL